MRPVAGPKQVRLMVVGDAGVGKTSLIQRFADDNFTSNRGSHVNMVTCQKTVEFEGNQYELTILDTNHEQDPRNRCYMGTDIVLVVYAINNWDSFDNVSKKWVPEIKQRLPLKPFILMANKADLVGQSRPNRYVSQFDGMQKCSDEHGAAFFECSALSGAGVENVFQEVPIVIEREFARLLQLPVTPPTPTTPYDIAMAPITLAQKAAPPLMQCYANIKESLFNPEAFTDSKNSVYSYYNTLPPVASTLASFFQPAAKTEPQKAKKPETEKGSDKTQKSDSDTDE
ncbi:unnamed protein product [Bursaphelenchus okinawaensis]|uniref:Uncharacterized protein n=1 Tax=Bursaphelenchus okinawaensis TaxID=465554 RepID=A0A811KXR5_9BILA|nr:unnamed protein product [Bursaphelenchus okinawaensis]CAG9112766.1 unnamed protein product [Bursaphelenchus okinawaensis]